MKHIKTAGLESFFRVVGSTRRSQAATMVLKPGDSTGGEDNRPREVRPVVLRGSLLLIKAGKEHEIKNSGAQPLVTINVYAPPAD